MLYTDKSEEANKYGTWKGEGAFSAGWGFQSAMTETPVFPLLFNFLGSLQVPVSSHMH